jgi:hyaluronan synthase
MELLLISLSNKNFRWGEQMNNLSNQRSIDSGKSMKLLIFMLFSLLVGVLFIIDYQAKGTFDYYLGIYGSAMITYLLGKMLLSFKYTPYKGEAPDLKVSVVIPSFNENPKAVKGTIESVLRQDYPIHEIFFVDDGSKDTSGFDELNRMKDNFSSWFQEVASEITYKGKPMPEPKLLVHRLPQNRGKRHAQIWAFERATGDVFVTLDSDGDLFPNTIRELLKPLVDKKVMAVTGHVNVRNREANLLTKLIDMRYDNAFRVERAAQSVTNNVLVCSGPLSCYRREVIDDNIEHYGSQTFLGEEVQFGDDRCLTNYAIRKGKTVYQSTSRCITDAPTSVFKFIKQQTRWNKSFFRESLVAIKIGLKKPLVLIWALLEMSLWILFGVSLVTSLVIKSGTMGWVLLLFYLSYISISAYARNSFYILKHPLTFILAPVYGILHLVILFPLRFYSLLTIKSNGWGTR